MFDTNNKVSRNLECEKIFSSERFMKLLKNKFGEIVVAQTLWSNKSRTTTRGPLASANKSPAGWLPNQVNGSTPFREKFSPAAPFIVEVERSRISCRRHQRCSSPIDQQCVDLLPSFPRTIEWLHSNETHLNNYESVDIVFKFIVELCE